MYHQEYEVTSVPALQRAISLADFYLVLPILSHSLTTCLILSPTFTHEMLGTCKFQSSEILLRAKQLHKKVLFKDTFVHAVGYYDPDDRDPVFTKTPKMLYLVPNYHIKLCKLM